MANNSDDYRYFIYSTSQMRDRIDIEKNIGKVFVPGTVVVGSRKLKYTELSKTGTSRYSDAIIVAQGNLSKMSYTKISSRNVGV